MGTLHSTMVRYILTIGLAIVANAAEHQHARCWKEDPANMVSIKYSRRVANTVSNYRCARGNDESQWDHKFKPEDDTHNYCRNPDNDEAGPWCYTDSMWKKWERCSVDECSNSVVERLTANDVKPGKQPADCRLATDRKGLGYQGNISVTARNRPCQRWDTNSPNRVQSKPAAGDRNHNHCRNPGVTSETNVVTNAETGNTVTFQSATLIKFPSGKPVIIMAQKNRRAITII